MKDLRARLMAAFQVEHKDHLDAVRTMLDRLEEAAWDPESIDSVELHRRIHSLKGAARAVDLRHIEALSHRLETMMSRHQRGDHLIEAGTARVIRSALDAIEDAAAAADGGGSDALPDSVLAAVDALAASADQAPPAAGSRVDEVPAPDIVPALPIGGAPRNLRIEAGSLDGLLECSAEVLAATGAQHRLSSDFGMLEQQLREMRQAVDTLRRGGLALGGAAAGTAGDVRFRDLDLRMHRFETRLRTFASAQRASGQKLRQLGRVLEDHVRRIRMIPAEAVFGGMRKMVRDLAVDEGKSVRVDARGLDTLADRSVLQVLSDPVMHVLRNAVGHGIEPPAERTASSKAPEGRIVLEVAAQGGRLVVRIEDDGRGIDLNRLRALAERQGMPVDATLSDPVRLAELLSTPGLSTSEAVTELAGRGIGLSVVASTVARLQGEFTIRPGPETGVIVSLSVPISVSSKRLVVVRCGEHAFAVPAHGVTRLHRVPRQQVETMEGRPVTRVDDGPPLRLVSLAALVGSGGPSNGSGSDQAGLLNVVVLRHRATQLGVVVDAFDAVQDGVVRDLRVAAGGKGPLAGAVVSADGSVMPVLDVPALVAAADTVEDHAAAAPAPSAPPKRRSILVVDDSITTRTLEKSILEASGYDVRLSVDGVDALDELRTRPAELVISDIEMPRMDGFELLRALKRDPELSAIPVVLVTSRNNEDDRRRGLSLGADAYVVKQRFDQTDLLTTIGQLL